jgi:hypothetical protein
MRSWNKVDRVLPILPVTYLMPYKTDILRESLEFGILSNQAVILNYN